MHVAFWSQKLVLTVQLPVLSNCAFHFQFGFEAFSLAISRVTVLSARLKRPLISQPSAILLLNPNNLL